MTKNEWISLCRGTAPARKMNRENRARAEAFLKLHLPLSGDVKMKIDDEVRPSNEDSEIDRDVDDEVPLSARIT